MKLKTILSQDAFWMVNKAIAKLVGIEAALLLSYLIDKEDSLNSVIRGEFAYFYRHSETIEQETSLTYTVQKSCIKRLENEQFISTCLMGIPRKLYFTIHELHILEKLNYINEETSTIQLRKSELIYNEKPINKKPNNEKPIIEKEITKNNFKNWTLEDFENDIKLHRAAVNFTKDQFMSFYEYWKELAPNGKMKFQMQKTWQTDLRLKYWSKNDFKWNKPNQTVQEKTIDKMKSAFEEYQEGVLNGKY